MFRTKCGQLCSESTQLVRENMRPIYFDDTFFRRCGASQFIRSFLRDATEENITLGLVNQSFSAKERDRPLSQPLNRVCHCVNTNQTSKRDVPNKRPVTPIKHAKADISALVVSRAELRSRPSGSSPLSRPHLRFILNNYSNTNTFLSKPFYYGLLL